MKKTYSTPIVKHVDFTYDTQVVAQSESFIRGEHTPFEWFEKCQVNNTACVLLYYADMTCSMDQGTDFSLRH